MLQKICVKMDLVGLFSVAMVCQQLRLVAEPILWSCISEDDRPTALILRKLIGAEVCTVD